MLDVLIAGAGPAGSIAGLLLARAGARVLLVDREAFPREKLCGDTLNPGAVAWLASIGLAGGPLDCARPIAGMIVGSPRLSVRAPYRQGAVGRAVRRRDLDAWLLDQAIAAGARFESGLVVREPLVDDSSGHAVVRGLRVDRRSGGGSLRMPASLTIAADGRRSVLARGAKLSSHPAAPRRWAFGAYATGIAGTGDCGEMHIRTGHYIGIAPVSDTLANICVVTGPKPPGPTPLAVMTHVIRHDPVLAPRFERAAFETKVSVLGPLAVDVLAAGVAGLLLAGDAAGFVDPMTGDGLHLAMRGGDLAAREALRVLESGDLEGAPARLAAARADAFRAKLRFNRVIRSLVDSSAGLGVASWGAMVAPGLVRRLVSYAGDAA